MRLLTILLRLGLNPALLAGLALMPLVVATGYVADRRHEGAAVSGALRGSFDALPPGPPPALSARF